MPNATCVAVAGRGLLIEGSPGSGKSSLALALIDRGAILVGDDGIALEVRGQRLWALPPPNITGLLEIRGVGIAELAVGSAPVCLVLTIGDAGPRLPTEESVQLLGTTVPRLRFAPGAIDALRAEWALRMHGLP